MIKGFIFIVLLAIAVLLMYNAIVSVFDEDKPTRKEVFKRALIVISSITISILTGIFIAQF